MMSPTNPTPLPYLLTTPVDLTTSAEAMHSVSALAAIALTFALLFHNAIAQDMRTSLSSDADPALPLGSGLVGSYRGRSEDIRLIFNPHPVTQKINFEIFVNGVPVSGAKRDPLIANKADANSKFQIFITPRGRLTLDDGQSTVLDLTETYKNFNPNAIGIDNGPFTLTLDYDRRARLRNFLNDDIVMAFPTGRSNASIPNLESSNDGANFLRSGEFLRSPSGIHSITITQQGVLRASNGFTFNSVPPQYQDEGRVLILGKNGSLTLYDSKGQKRMTSSLFNGEATPSLQYWLHVTNDGLLEILDAAGKQVWAYAITSVSATNKPSELEGVKRIGLGNCQHIVSKSSRSVALLLDANSQIFRRTWVSLTGNTAWDGNAVEIPKLVSTKRVSAQINGGASGAAVGTDVGKFLDWFAPAGGAPVDLWQAAVIRTDEKIRVRVDDFDCGLLFTVQL